MTASSLADCMYVSHVINTYIRFTYSVQAYDSHCNIVLGDVTETVYIVDDEDDENTEMRVRCAKHTRWLVADW